MSGGADWSLEAELSRLAGEPDLTRALHQLGLLDTEQADFTLEVVQSWHRSGAETYALRFAVHSQATDRHCLMKACVAYSAGIPLTDLFGEWLSRRDAIRAAGVQTPELYARGPALLVEEFIPYQLSDAVRRADSGGSRGRLMDEIGRTCGLVVRAGFAPLSAHDWRSRGTDVVTVDFGQDLGRPVHSAEESEAGLLSEVLDGLARAGAALSSDDLRRVGDSYELSLGRR